MSDLREAQQCLMNNISDSMANHCQPLVFNNFMDHCLNETEIVNNNLQCESENEKWDHPIKEK